MPAPLPVRDILFNALMVPWQQRTVLLRTLFLPVLGWVLLTRLGQDWARDSWLRMIPISIAWAILYTYFAVTCHRLVLIGEQAVPRFGLTAFTPRELRFLLFLGLIYAMYMLAIMIGLMVFGTLVLNVLPDSDATAPRLMAALAMVMSLLASGYLFARFGLVLPATALDKKLDLAWAWQRSRGNSLRLFLVVGLIPYSLTYLVGLMDVGAGSVASIFYTVLGFILLVIEIAALSLSYQALTVAEPA